MFARSFTQATRGAVGSIRRYATEAPKTTSRALPLAGAAAAASIGAYYYLQSDAAPVAAKSGQSNFTGVSAAPNKVFTGGDQGFVSLKLASTENVSHNVKKLRFHLGDDDAVSGLDVASAVLTKYKGPEMEKAVLRPYTPTSDEDAKGYLEFIIKKYPNGPMSTHMFDLVPGQRLDVKGPLPKYNWTENKHEHVAMITGGTGITPMWQLCRAIFKNPNDKTKVTLVFGNISEEDIILKQELAQLENDYPQRFRAFYTLDKPSEGWQQGKGHITKELLQTVLPDPKKGGNVKAFVCGPPGLYKAVSGAKVSPKDQGDLTGYLADLGWTKEQVFKF